MNSTSVRSIKAKKLPSYDQQNRSAVEIILKDAAGHGGPDPLMVR